jgi:hypothetical protein
MVCRRFVSSRLIDRLARSPRICRDFPQSTDRFEKSKYCYTLFQVTAIKKEFSRNEYSGNRQARRGLQGMDLTNGQPLAGGGINFL